jgi:hypothetical protein
VRLACALVLLLARSASANVGPSFAVGTSADVPLDRDSWIASVGPATVVEAGLAVEGKPGARADIAIHYARQRTTFLLNGTEPDPAPRTDIGLTMRGMAEYGRFALGAELVCMEQHAGSTYSNAWQLGPIVSSTIAGPVTLRVHADATASLHLMAPDRSDTFGLAVGVQLAVRFVHPD